MKQIPGTKEKPWKGHLGSPSFFMSTLSSRLKDDVGKYMQHQLTEYNAGRPRQ